MGNYGFYAEHHHLGDGGYPGDALIDAANEAIDLRAENERLRAENERLRKVENDALWLARLACGSSWPMEMAQRVEDAAARVRAAFSGSQEADDSATPCRWCGCRLDTCRPLRADQRKCCPDCEHTAS